VDQKSGLIRRMAFGGSGAIRRELLYAQIMIQFSRFVDSEYHDNW
jgi:hypothetical protein